jgi:tetratricopeptide (TPR) repeat protein
LTSDGSTHGLRTTREARGTGGYRPPELLTDDKRLFGKKSDIWALGCILYEICVGNHAFKSDFEILNYALEKQPLQPAFPHSLEKASSILLSWIREMLHWDFQDRPTASGSGRHFAKLLSLTTRISPEDQANWEESDLLNVKNLLGTDLPITSTDGMMNNGSPRWEEVLCSGGSRKYNLGVSRRAKNLVDARDTLLGKKHSLSIWSRVRLAWTDYYIGNIPVTIEDSEFTALMQLKGDTEDRETAAFWAGLGWTAFALRDCDSALRHFEKAIEIQRRLGHRTDSDTLSHYVGLARVQLGVAGDFMKAHEKSVTTGKRKRTDVNEALASALDSAQQAVKILHVTLLCQKASSELGQDHAETAETMSLLAYAHQIVSKIENVNGYRPKTALPYEESAEALYEEAFAVQESKLGIDHPQTLLSLHEIAVINLENGHIADAVQKLETILEKQKVVLGKDDEDTKATVDSLLRAYRMQGETAKYNKLHRESNPKPRLPMEKPKRRQNKTKAAGADVEFKAVEYCSSQASL